MRFSTRIRWIPFPSARLDNLGKMRHADHCNWSRSITPFVVFVLSTQFTACCYFASLACMTELMAVETFQRIRDKYIHFHLQKAYLYCRRQVRTIKCQEQSVSWYISTALLHRHPANINYSLIIQLISDVYQFSTPDDPSGQKTVQPYL